MGLNSMRTGKIRVIIKVYFNTNILHLLYFIEIFKFVKKTKVKDDCDALIEM